jgi:hypothetical protein
MAHHMIGEIETGLRPTVDRKLDSCECRCAFSAKAA